MKELKLKVSTQDGKHFTLERETEVDHVLIDQLAHARAAYVETIVRQARQLSGPSGVENLTASLVVDPASKPALVVQAGRQALSALGQLFSLGMGEAAKHGHVSAAPANPQAHEQLTACLVQLQVMLESLRDVVVKQEIMLKKICSTHEEPFVVEAAIVKE